jgi:hypothetical protein
VSYGSRGPVIIDTGVFGARLTPRGQSLASAYRPLLDGRPAVISFIRRVGNARHSVLIIRDSEHLSPCIAALSLPPLTSISQHP